MSNPPRDTNNANQPQRPANISEGTAGVNVTDPPWLYINNQGNVYMERGSAMSYWLQAGYFHDNVPLRAAEDEHFHSLGEYKRACSHSNPFAIGVTSINSALRRARAADAPVGRMAYTAAFSSPSNGNGDRTNAIPPAQQVVGSPNEVHLRQPPVMPSHYQQPPQPPQQPFIQPVSMGAAGFPFPNAGLASNFTQMGMHPAANVFQLTNMPPPQMHQPIFPSMYMSPAVSVYSSVNAMRSNAIFSPSFAPHAGNGGDGGDDGDGGDLNELGSHPQALDDQQTKAENIQNYAPAPPKQFADAETQTEPIEITLAEVEDFLRNLLGTQVKIILPQVAYTSPPVEGAAEEGGEDELFDSNLHFQPPQPEDDEEK